MGFTRGCGMYGVKGAKCANPGCPRSTHNVLTRESLGKEVGGVPVLLYDAGQCWKHPWKWGRGEPSQISLPVIQLLSHEGDELQAFGASEVRVTTSASGFSFFFTRDAPWVVHDTKGPPVANVE